MRRMQIASFLPERILSVCARRFDTPGAFELPELGSSFFMDAHYLKYVRHDKRKRNPGPIRQRVGVMLALADDFHDWFHPRIPWFAMCGILVVVGYTLHYL